MSFITTLDVTTTLYRGVKDIAHLNGKWYALKAEHTYGYGDYIGEFKPTRELRLIDISRQEFYNDYTHKLNQLNNNNILSLYPLGFTNEQYYIDISKKMGLNPANPPYTPEVEYKSQLYGNKSRNSILGFDNDFLILLEKLYGTICDGFISQINLPNKIMNGMHHSEMAVFDSNIIQLIRHYPKPSQIPQPGGGMTCNKTKIVGAIELNNEFTEFSRKNLELILKTNTFDFSKPNILPDQCYIDPFSNIHTSRINRKNRK